MIISTTASQLILTYLEIDEILRMFPSCAGRQSLPAPSLYKEVAR